MKLEGKVMLITGASSGIGRAVALKAAQDKPTLILASRNKDKLEQVKTEVGKLGAKATVIPTDVTKVNEIRDLFLKIQKDFDSLDVVFNNAGLGYIANIQELTEEQIKKMIDVNIKGMIMVSKFASEILTRQKSKSHLIMTSSLAGLIAVPEWSVYTATKWAITGFADSIRQELKKYDIQVTTLHPGAVQTEFFDKNKANVNAEELGGIITSEQVADSVYDAIFTDKKRVIIPASSKVYAKIYKYLPGLTEKLIDKMTGDIEYHKEKIPEDEPKFDKASK